MQNYTYMYIHIVFTHTHTHTPEYVPCPVFECENSVQKIVQQPADLPSLSENMLSAATSFIKTTAGQLDMHMVALLLI